jgi:hypothetical protein
MKTIAELRIGCLMRRRAHAPEEPDLLLLRNAEFQIMLSALPANPLSVAQCVQRRHEIGATQRRNDGMPEYGTVGSKSG